jgi:hypothetical protein
VDGSHSIVTGLFQGRIEAVPLSQMVPVTQDLSTVAVNSFFKLNDSQLAYVTAINADGLCMCTGAQGAPPIQFGSHMNSFLIGFGYIASNN